MKNFTLPPKPFPLLVIVGPTSSGKSELAVQLARRFNGEIISCDSRQIYRGMDLGTGKVEGKWVVDKIRGRVKRQHYIYKRIPHHLIDFASPKRQYSVAEFKAAAQKAINDIITRGKLPILCGGTGHWIDAVVYDQQIPNVKPNPKLRSQLEKKSAAELYRKLQKLDPRRAASIDRHNPRRLIRALEIVLTTGKPVPDETWNMKHEAYRALWIGINPTQHILHKKIERRLNQRLDAGMLKEVARLHRGPLPFSKGEAGRGLSWKRLTDFGLEYKWCALFLQKKISREEMYSQLLLAIHHYTKRQITWWKRNKNINWITSPAQAGSLTKKFLA